MGIRREQIHQSIRLPIRQRAQEHRIDQAEDRSACPDTQGKRAYRRDGETRASPQRPYAILRVLHKGFNPWQAAPFPLCLLRLLHAPKLEKSLAPRFLRRKTGADACVGMQRDVGFQLGRKLVLSLAAAKDAQHAKTEST